MKSRHIHSSNGQGSKAIPSKVYDRLESAMENRAREVGTKDKEKPESAELTNWSEAELDVLEF